MQIRTQLEALIEQMLDGQIMLDEAMGEFEKVYIQKALVRNKERLSQTADKLGIHRNTLSKRVAAYAVEDKKPAKATKKASKKARSRKT
jgi:DNA-binding NtrC family response regulator